MKEKRFVVYRLQKLAILLRILGLDVLYFQNEDYISVIDLTKREYRILLSRVKFLKKLPWIFYLYKDDIDGQLEQIIGLKDVFIAGRYFGMEIICQI